MLCKNYCRFSINGWFHTKTPLKFDNPIYEPPTTGIFSETSLSPITYDGCVGEWIRPAFLESEIMQAIQHQVGDTSEISLPRYFNEKKFEQLLATLTEEGKQ